MTNSTTNLLINAISLTQNQLLTIKNNIARQDWGILLESADDQHVDSRWSIYTAQPIATLTSTNGHCKIHQGNQSSTHHDDPFTLLESLRHQLFHTQSSQLTIPFTGGALGYISYELGYQLENITHSNKPDGLALPELMFGFYDWALIVDNKGDQPYLVVHKTKDQAIELVTFWQNRFDWLIKQCENKPRKTAFKLNSTWSSNLNKQTYTEKFNQIQHYILSGDCYQVNLTQRFTANYQGDEYQAYRALLKDNCPPFAAFLRFPSQTILSLSPERFLKLDDGIVETKPIKGTYPRFEDKQQDNQSRQRLINSEKDRAENLMIVDLMRNDIGRVCQPGSVRVPKLFAIESFPAVHHLVSTVLGELASQYSCEDLLRACFPGGSITGAPKIRAMGIIAELEPNQRQIYCGSIGYINSDGNMDMNISIRTLVCHEQMIYCWAGGGLVADSNVDAEYQECLDKVSKILPCLTALNKQ